MKSNNRITLARRKAVPIVGALIAVLMVFGLVQLMAADDTPLPLPPGSSPYAENSPTDEELLQRDPSIERYLDAHFITPDRLLGSDLSTSTKSVNRDEATPGTSVMFTIVINNSGDTDATIEMSDALPSQVTYQSHDFGPPTNGIGTGGGEENGVVTWMGVLGANGSVQIDIIARVNENVSADTVVTNQANISGGGEQVNVEASFTVVELGISPIVQLPFISYGFTPDPPNLTIQATRPNSNNEWLVSWNSAPGADAYQLEAAQAPDFSASQIFDMGLATSKAFNPDPSPFNVYYYRARSSSSGVFGEWSDVITVVGGYRDDFTNPNTGWAIRRTTNIDKVKTWYEIEPGKDWLILQVHDRWDWGISSPLKAAPDVPYVIDYEAKVVSIGNLVSLGSVWGGDWNEVEPCPDTSTVEGWYEHDICFNHFYNANIIWFAHLKLLFERVDELVWCPECGGSPMKRLGDTEVVESLYDVDSEGWNHYRVEVRENGIKFYAGKRDGQLHLQFEYGDTRWIGDPYFGVFASTDEYNNSTARYEYFQVMPLDG